MCRKLASSLDPPVSQALYLPLRMSYNRRNWHFCHRNLLDHCQDLQNQNRKKLKQEIPWDQELWDGLLSTKWAEDAPKLEWAFLTSFKNELLREKVSFRDRWILENIWSVTFIFQKRLNYSSWSQPAQWLGLVEKNSDYKMWLLIKVHGFI